MSSTLAHPFLLASARILDGLRPVWELGAFGAVMVLLMLFIAWHIRQTQRAADANMRDALRQFAANAQNQQKTIERMAERADQQNAVLHEIKDALHEANETTRSENAYTRELILNIARNKPIPYNATKISPQQRFRK